MFWRSSCGAGGLIDLPIYALQRFRLGLQGTIPKAWGVHRNSALLSKGYLAVFWRAEYVHM